MQPHAALMNIARGGVAVWDEVLAALRAGTISAYYTDVADSERRALPSDHPDWQLTIGSKLLNLLLNRS